MKSLKFLPAFLCISFLLLTTGTSYAKARDHKKDELPKVQKLDIAPNLYQSENMFFSGQPTLETFEWLKENGVDLIINLRSEKENDKFSKSAFNEKNTALKLGMKYVSLPISGNDSYTKENLAKFSAALDKNYNKVLIHCASCGRVSNFIMAYLVQSKGYQLSEAIEFGKQLTFKFPLENLLDEEIIWKTE